MAEFPLDLTSQILRLLPVSTLLRFKCVSKTFFSLIDCPDFIKLHLYTNSEHKTHRKIVFQNYPNLVPLYVLDIDNPIQPLPDFLLKPPETNDDSDIEHADSGSGDSNDQISPSDEDSDGENSHTDEDSGSDEDSNNQVSNTFYSPFFAHCNGLVLIGERDMSRFGVWNPSTRKYWKMPYHRDLWVKDCCFGYDPSTDDYKVLIVDMVYFCPHCDDCTDSRRPEFWILGLRSGCWKKIERDYPFSCNEDWMANDVCFVDGAFYFTSDEQCFIHSIDLLEEKFSRVSLPSDIKKTDFVLSLQVFEGYLCAGFGRMKIMNRRDLFDDDDDDDEEDGTENLYIRKKNDNGEFFWTKLLSFGWEDFGLNVMANGGMDRLVGYLKGRDKVFVLNSGDECELYFYDYEEKSTERIVNGYMKKNVKAIFCVESLVCLDYLTRIEEDDDDESKLGEV